MKQMHWWTAALLVIALAGCASQPAQNDVNPRKAAEVNSELGLRYMVQGNNEVAMEKLLKALEYDSDHVAANHYIAELYRRVGENDKAERHYREAMKRAPKDSSISNNYGSFLCAQGRYDEAEKQLLRVIENPVYAARDQAYENLGQCMSNKRDIDKAERYFREALRANPKLARSLYAMAEISLQQGNYTSARGFLQRYEAVAPHTPQTLWLGIRVERMLGDKNALSSYELSLRNNFPDAEETQLYLKSKKP